MSEQPVRMRDTWYRAGDISVCIWCTRDAALCVIEDPCADRQQNEAEHERTPPDIFALAGIAAATHCLAESPLGFVCSQAPGHDGWHRAILLDGRRLDAWPPE